MEERFLDEYAIEALTHYGSGVNNERQIASESDGLKPVYRRVIYTAMKLPDKMTKTAAISGNTIATVHPHSSDSVDAVVSSLVNWGIFEGQGNHGMKLIYGENILPSASRYTEAKVDPRWRNIFSELLPYVPYKEAEMEGNVEPIYLPTPLPMILLFSGMGIGFGANARYPMFTPDSLYKAYIKDDPYLLKAPGGLEIDQLNSELQEIWYSGYGKITYKYQVTRETNAAGEGIVIKGSAELFKPRLNEVFEGELNRQRLYILDQTSSDIPEVFIGRTPGVHLTLDEIQETCESVCSYTKTFRLTVSDGNQVYIIPLKEWIDKTYNNYTNLIEIYKADKISKLEFDYRVYKWLPIVTELLLNNRDFSAEQLVDSIADPDCDIEVVRAILRKTINTLRNTDSADKLKSIEEQIGEFKKLNPDDYIYEIIKKF